MINNTTKRMIYWWWQRLGELFSQNTIHLDASASGLFCALDLLTDALKFETITFETVVVVRFSAFTKKCGGINSINPHNQRLNQELVDLK